MGRRWRFWPLTGFLTAAVLGTLAHFAYRWSGGALLAGVFCAVNESVWEHMKLLFFPVFLFTAAQFCVGERDGLLAARAVSVTAGLALIPTLYYTYTGVWGDHVLWADAAIFYLSAAVTFWMDDLLHRQRRSGRWDARWRDWCGCGCWHFCLSGGPFHRPTSPCSGTR